MSAGSAGALCAVHPGAAASFACARCGTYACAQCSLRTMCRPCLERFARKHRTRANLIRGLGVVYGVLGAWSAAVVGTLLALPIERALAVAVFGPPFVLIGLGLYRLDGRSRLFGIVAAPCFFGLTGQLGWLLVAWAAYALLPKAALEVCSPLFQEAESAARERPRGRWLPAWVAAGATIVFWPFLAAHTPRQIQLQETGLRTGHVLALGAVALLLFVFSRGKGWAARARTQMLVWVVLAFTGYTSGVAVALATVAGLIAALCWAVSRQRVPRLAPLRAQPVDMTAFADRARLVASLQALRFEPFCQLSSVLARGKIDEDVYLRDGQLCRLTATTVSGATAYTVYFETWFEDGGSVRTSNEVRWEALNDRDRHPLHQHVVGNIDELYELHSRYVSAEARAPRAIPSVADYLALRRESHRHTYERCVDRGLVHLRGDEYRLGPRAMFSLIANTFDLPGALARERHW